MAEDKRIVIDVQNTVNIATADKDTGTMRRVERPTEKAAGALDTLNVMMLLRGFEQAGSILSQNNKQAQEMIRNATKAVRYGSLGIRAAEGVAEGDYSQLAVLALRLATDALQTAMQAAAKTASEQNSADASAIDAGVLDISNSKIGTHWFTGRYKYNHR